MSSHMWGGKVVWWGSGVDTYLSRRSAPDWGPSRQHLRPPGCHRGWRRQQETSDAIRGLGRSPSIEAPQGIFFCGTVTFDQKILRKFLPQYPEPPGPGPKHLARTSPGAWTSPPNPGLDRWWSVWTRVVPQRLTGWLTG